MYCVYSGADLIVCLLICRTLLVVSCSPGAVPSLVVLLMIYYCPTCSFGGKSMAVERVVIMHVYIICVCTITVFDCFYMFDNCCNDLFFSFLILVWTFLKGQITKMSVQWGLALLNVSVLGEMVNMISMKTKLN
jgi:hypothetical protein